MLKKMLGKTIELNQCASVESRLLLKNVLLATEVVKDYHKPSITTRFALKLDISKAFDTIQWQFIVKTLRVIAYPEQFIQWIICVCLQHLLQYHSVVNWRTVSLVLGA